MKKFKTSDGYTLYLTDQGWVDSLDPDTVDMTFDADAEGWPVDSQGQHLGGDYIA